VYKLFFNTLFIFLWLITFNCQAQIKDGFFAPNAELTDLDGNTHNLFSILDEGKTNNIAMKYRCL